MEASAYQPVPNSVVRREEFLNESNEGNDAVDAAANEERRLLLLGEP
jgi:hypothetical protein